MPLPVVLTLRSGLTIVQPTFVPSVGTARGGFGRAIGGATINLDQEPTFTGAPGQTEVPLIAESDAKYDSAFAAGVDDSDSRCRWAPVPSPVFDGSAVNTSLVSILATGGKDGGKALRLNYTAGGGQIGIGWIAILPDPVPTAAQYICMTRYFTVTGDNIDGVEFRYKHRRNGRNAALGGDFPQFSTADGGSGPPPGYNSLFEVNNSGGNGDRARQPVGPYFQDFMNDGLWHRETTKEITHNGVDFSRGMQRMWIDGVLMINWHLSGVGVTPDGGDKPWLDAACLEGGLVNLAGIGAWIVEIGGVRSSSTNAQVIIDHDLPSNKIWLEAA